MRKPFSELCALCSCAAPTPLQHTASESAAPQPAECRAADLLRQGDPAGAEALVKDHAALLQVGAAVDAERSRSLRVGLRVERCSGSHC